MSAAAGIGRGMTRTAITLLLLAVLAHCAVRPDINLDGWWSEGGERVWIEQGRLHMKADSAGAGVMTVWRRAPHPGNFVLELDAHVVSSSQDVNNINLFFSYSDPSGKPLEETSESRKSADYALYHKLDGYIITFLNDPQGQGQARIRIRRNPGFKLLAETFAYHCRRGVTYHLRVTKQAGDIRFSVDGRELLRATDPEPLGGGHFALRTYRTWLWWDDIQLPSTPSAVSSMWKTASAHRCPK